MRKALPIVLFLILGFSANAQQIPNGGFEQWFFNSATMSNEPVGWTTSNFGLYDDTGVSKYQPAHTGNYACGLKTNFILGTFTFPGVVSTIFPISSLPDAMEGYFKGNLSLDDTTEIFIEFSKDTNVIGDGSLFITQSESNWTKFSIPIDFFGSGNPDSCRITIIGGGLELDDTFTYIAVDDLTFNYPVNIKKVDLNIENDLKLYPNPTTDLLNISYDQKFNAIVIYNMSGQLVGRYENEISLSVAEFEKGIYYLQLLDEMQQPVAGRSFIKN